MDNRLQLVKFVKNRSYVLGTMGARGIFFQGWANYGVWGLRSR